jgi:hypothetical protein
MLEWINKTRTDVKWVKGPDANGGYQWDVELPDQEQISQLVSEYDPNRALTTEEVQEAQRKSDIARFTKRAEAKNKILAEMAAENMTRVRTGVWTVEQLVALTLDPVLKNILDDINTLSFEIAYSKLATLDNPIATPEILAGWQEKLLENFFN